MRCRVRCAMGPAMMVTIGVLFLLQTLDIIGFHYTWPVILIVIGVVQVLAHSAPATGHVQPAWWTNRMQPPPQNPPAPYTPPPPSSSESGTGGSNV
ncbi:MAG TPA: DUF5668 domain-containing protein [Vicinamibacterales bacterium]|nr:DUF5668 domain-containing protein [Vicinamibacterales bacterium]